MAVSSAEHFSRLPRTLLAGAGETGVGWLRLWLRDLAGAGPMLLAKKTGKAEPGGKTGRAEQGRGVNSAGGKPGRGAPSSPRSPQEDDPESPAPEDEECDDDETEAELGEENPELLLGEAHETAEGDEEEEHGRRRKTSSEWSSGSGPDDPDLIAGFLKGDEEDFTRLVVKYQHKIYNLCYRILGDRDEAQDMAQEVFLSVHKSLKDFRGDSLFSTWVFRVAVNHCKNRIKYLGRRQYYHSVSLDQPRVGADPDEGELHHEVEDEGPNAESQLSSEEIQKLVQDAISSLDPDHRIVILLRDIQDLSYEEIADVVGIKVGTIKSRIHRARIELKKKLENRIK